MSTEQSQKIIDSVIYERSPIFPNMYLASQSLANELFEKYGGIFHAWLQRPSTSRPASVGQWLQCVLRVRYVLSIGLGFVIRCKLNMPTFEDGRPNSYLEYDGFLILKTNRIFWIFEKRQKERNDQLYFITGIGRVFERVTDPNSKDRSLSGTYLCTDQDASQSVMSGPIFIQRFVERPDRGKEDQMVTLMHETARIIQSASENEKICNVYRKFKKECSEQI
jgi:hypothetical protein